MDPLKILNKLEITKRIWAKRAKDRQKTDTKITAWSDSPIIHQLYINPLISGETYVGWFEWSVKNYLQRPAERILNIGCGDGALERHGVILEAARLYDACDISPGAIELAKQIAKEQGIEKIVNYYTANLNHHMLPEHYYDAVFASQSLHHIEKLEHLFEQIQKALKPDGVFVVNEFVGPNQFQWTDTQLRYANELLMMIPESYRMGINSGKLKETVKRPTISHMNRVDPTEAIRSQDLLSLLSQYFTIIAKRDFGGTLLNIVLEDIIGNFSDNENDKAIIKKLCDIELDLINKKEISSDFTIKILKK